MKLHLVALLGAINSAFALWQQCGGAEWAGSTACALGETCHAQNEHYSQCVASSQLTSVAAPVLAAAPFNSLYFVKYVNPGSGSTEVHTALSQTSYSTFGIQTATPGRPNDATNGQWGVESDNVYFIKTKNADSQTIEVHRLSKGSNYSKWDIQTATGFSSRDGSNGIFTIDNGDLYFIKTKNVESGFIEVHKANHQNGWAVDFHQATGFSADQAKNGYFTLRGGNLYFIKTRGTKTKNVEVHIAKGPGYKNPVSQKTWFNTADDKNGTWDINISGDLYFIKTQKPQSERIEVHVVTATSDYQADSHYATVFDAKDANNGFWLV